MKLSKENSPPRQESAAKAEQPTAKNAKLMEAAGTAAKLARNPLKDVVFATATHVDFSARTRDREVGKAHAALTRPQATAATAAPAASASTKAARRKASVTAATKEQIAAMLPSDEKA